MIVGIGCDITKIARFKDQSQSLVQRILTPEEYGIYTSYQNHRKDEYIAGRFAAKEALIKALGPSYTFQDFSIQNDTNGKPFVHVDDHTVFLSISHEKEYAIAYALVEK